MSVTDDLHGTAQQPRVEFRYWPGDGSLYEAEFGDSVVVNIVQDFSAADIDPRGWVMAKEPLPVGDQRAEVSGIKRMVRHAPGHLTPDQRRIVELETEVQRLRLILEEREQDALGVPA